jgi:polyisoprenoid-binding protein YceI
MYRLDQNSAHCTVLTFKEGLLSAVAHDLEITVGRFDVDVDEAARTVEGRFDATSLRVVCAMREGHESKGALSADQEREIESNIVRYMLAAEKYPEIRYVSHSVTDDGDGFRIAGQLSLHGRQHGVDVLVRKEPDRYVASARLHQPDLGIRPYSAMLGALEVKADVEVRLEVPWPAKALPIER